MTDDLKRLLDHYATVTPHAQRAILDDLYTQARAVTEPLIRTGYTDAILHLTGRWSQPRRESQRTPSRTKKAL